MGRRVGAVATGCALAALVAAGSVVDDTAPMGAGRSERSGSSPAGPTITQAASLFELPPETATIVESATVRVRAMRSVDGATITGSGFVLGEGRGGVVVTGRHLVERSLVAEVSGSSMPVPLDGAVSARSGRRDLALLLLSAPGSPGAGSPGLRLAIGDPRPGDPVVMAARFDDRVEQVPAAVAGIVDGNAYGVDGPVLLLDPGSVPGFSGGPVVDGTGRVVGVLNAVDRSTGLAIATPVSELRSWLEGLDPLDDRGASDR